MLSLKGTPKTDYLIDQIMYRFYGITEGKIELAANVG